MGHRIVSHAASNVWIPSEEACFQRELLTCWACSKAVAMVDSKMIDCNDCGLSKAKMTAYLQYKVALLTY